LNQLERFCAQGRSDLQRLEKVKASVMEPNTREQRIRILLVEDEFLIAEWVAESLAEQGFFVQIACNAGDALRHLAASTIDVLFTDINLPGGMDGTALARRARELFPHLPVIYASAKVATLAPEARVPGAIFLRKPYEPEAVGRLIADATQKVAASVLA
jgi:DNA-binding NtrC family response regulator